MLGFEFESVGASPISFGVGNIAVNHRGGAFLWSLSTHIGSGTFFTLASNPAFEVPDHEILGHPERLSSCTVKFEFLNSVGGPTSCEVKFQIFNHGVMTGSDPIYSFEGYITVAGLMIASHTVQGIFVGRRVVGTDDLPTAPFRMDDNFGARGSYLRIMGNLPRRTVAGQ